MSSFRTRLCPACGMVFQANAHNQVLCSKICQKRMGVYKKRRLAVSDKADTNKKKQIGLFNTDPI